MKNVQKFYTDMADERVDEYKKKNNLTEVEGIKITKDDSLEFATVVNVEVLNENGASTIQKEIGKYITIECKDLNYLDEQQENKLSCKINEIIRSLINNDKASIMVIGLGNAKITPDSLGSRVTNKLDITRHLLKFASEFTDENTREISSITPGVLGTTGIETAEIVNSVASVVKPNVIIVIDSLMSQSMSRLGKTVQITDKGIIPGAGVGNVRKAIKEEYLKLPVIAIGVPLVVEAATITSECLDIINNIDKNHTSTYDEIKNALNVTDSNMIVVPKDIDELVENLSKIIASSINMMK